jgi:hypothetical protein
MRPLWIAALLTIVSAACDIAPSERCSEGRKWSDQYQGCVAPEPAPVWTDLGATCSVDGDCRGPTATSCLLDPTNTSAPGMCTIQNCSAAACGGTDFRCCDCTESQMLGSIWTAPVCVPSADVATLSTVASCTCE